MMRLFSSLAFQPRNVHRLMRNSYGGGCFQCMYLRGVINFVNCKNLYATANEKYVSIHPNISVVQLAEKLNVEGESILHLVETFDYDTRNGHKTLLDEDMAELIADEFGFLVVKAKNENVHLRPPVVTIMGHVDHGKTTLLDHLRKTSVARNEAGGITQSIGAFSVEVPGLTDTITFVDTPGHAAFNSMRARGAQLTDIVVLVIAADDGVMVQTKECLKHISRANVPFIVVVNKIDNPRANPEKIFNQLLSHGVQVEGYGGHTKMVNISALKGTNVDQLLLLLNNFAKEKLFVASHDVPVEGMVLEVEKNNRQGVRASILIKNGQLTKRKVLVAGSSMCIVRQMYDANGKVLDKAFPSDPVQIFGWKSLPAPGAEVFEMENLKVARNFLQSQAREREKFLKPIKSVQQQQPKTIPKDPWSKKGVNDEKVGRNKVPFRIQMKRDAIAAKGKEETNKVKEINVIVKTDASGSMEALVGILSKFHSQHVKLKIVSASVGQVTTTDIHLAETVGGMVYCFNSSASKYIADKAENLNVPLKVFDVIYKLLDDLKEEIVSVIPPKILEHVIGEGEILQVFQKINVAGCRVTVGRFDKSINNTVWRVVRDNNVIHNGVLTSLKRGTSDVSVVKQFSECGVMLDCNNYQAGDKIICVEQEFVPVMFEWEL